VRGRGASSLVFSLAPPGHLSALQSGGSGGYFSDSRRSLKRRRLPGTAMRAVLGHITWALLMGRESLSILKACYAFAERAGCTEVLVWPSVVFELEQVIGILPLLRACLGATWILSRRRLTRASSGSDFATALWTRVSSASSAAPVRVAVTRLSQR
jgi:hypothetical protein